MTENFQKVKPITKSLGNGNYFRIVPTADGYHCNCNIAGEHIQFEDTDLNAIEVKIADSLTKLNIDYMNKAIKLEEISLRIKENGLEKTSQYFNAPKNELDWPKE